MKEITRILSKKNIEVFSKLNKEAPTDLIPYVQPGYNDRKIRPQRKNPILKRDPEIFKEFCKGAKKNIEEDINMIFITSWNEWNESSQVEPAKEYGFDYLDVIKETLA